MIKHTFTSFLNLNKIKYKIQQICSIYHYCNMCGIPNHNLICNTCYNELEIIDNNTCEQCKVIMPLTYKTLEINYKKCWNCSNKLTYFDNLYCQFAYGNPLKYILHQFKYSKNIKYHSILAYIFYNGIKNAPTPDIIIPMPLHKSKLKTRGFNQADKLLHFYKIFNNNFLINKYLVSRTKDTANQALSSRINRHNNLNNAFNLHSNVNNLHIAIVDDVVTTGSTCNELSKLLKTNGAKRVDIWCLMRTNYAI